MRVEKLSRIWQHCDALGVSATLCGAKDERRAFHDREKAGEAGRKGWRAAPMKGETGEHSGRQRRWAREGNGLGHVISWGGDERESGRDIGGVAIGFLSVAAAAELEWEMKRPSANERDGMRRVRLVTLYRANFGTALENFSLAVFRGKLGEFPTWPIVLHYGDDKVYSPRARAIERYVLYMYTYIFGWNAEIFSPNLVLHRWVMWFRASWFARTRIFAVSRLQNYKI